MFRRNDSLSPLSASAVMPKTYGAAFTSLARLSDVSSRGTSTGHDTGLQFPILARRSQLNSSFTYTDARRMSTSPIIESESSLCGLPSISSTYSRSHTASPEHISDKVDQSDYLPPAHDLQIFSQSPSAPVADLVVLYKRVKTEYIKLKQELAKAIEVYELSKRRYGSAIWPGSQASSSEVQNLALDLEEATARYDEFRCLYTIKKHELLSLKDQIKPLKTPITTPSP